jgi:hypothetical protein
MRLPICTQIPASHVPVSRGIAKMNDIHQNSHVIVSTGDSGSAGCDAGTISFGATTSAGLGVNGLASTPWNIAVGGTDFDVLYTTSLATVEQYIQVLLKIGTDSGNSPYFGSAFAFIPEEPRNNSTDVFTTYENNVPHKCGNGPENTYAGGGGMSCNAACSRTIGSSGSCSGSMSGYSKPAFQTAITPTDNVRDIPDVSFLSGLFMSDEGFSQDFNSAWGICGDATITGSPFGIDCVPSTGTQGCNGACGIANIAA